MTYGYRTDDSSEELLVTNARNDSWHMNMLNSSITNITRDLTVCVYLCICARVCMCVGGWHTYWTYQCISICIYVYTYHCTYRSVYIHILIHLHMCTYTDTRVYTGGIRTELNCDAGSKMSHKKRKEGKVSARGRWGG